jgi:hypothetical protein
MTSEQNYKITFVLLLFGDSKKRENFRYKLQKVGNFAIAEFTHLKDAVQ